MFWTSAGPVLGMAELLSPCSAVPIGLQPFRFIAMDDTDLQRLVGELMFWSSAGPVLALQLHHPRTA